MTRLNKKAAYYIFIVPLLMFSVLFVQATEQESWEEDNWEDESWDEKESPWNVSGFAELGYGTFLQTNATKSSMSLAEFRTRIKANYSHQKFEFTGSGDVIYDEVLEDTLWQTREFHLSGSLSNHVDVKVGRQILTWGTGDYLFLNDLFAKDWQSFFSGREDEYLKAPSDSIRLTSYWQDITFDIAWTPNFEPDRYLTGERFSFFSSMAQDNVAPAEHFQVNQTTDPQWAGRISTTINSVEYALYGYQGYWTTPVGMTAQGVAYFPKLNSWGASALTPFARGIAKVEFSFYNSLEDRHGNNPNVANSQVRLLVGYEQEVAKNLTLGLQYYVEKTQDYQRYMHSAPDPKQAVNEYRQLVTARLRYATHQQSLVYSLFTFYSPSDQDAYIKPSVNYRHSDTLSFSVGANLFWGEKQYSFFGQHQENTNVWLRTRYQF